jgi:hypothetical protein
LTQWLVGGRRSQWSRVSSVSADHHTMTTRSDEWVHKGVASHVWGGVGTVVGG